MQAVARGVGVGAGAVYLALCALVLLLVAGEGNGNYLVTVAVMAVPCVASALFLRTFRRPPRASARVWRALAWVGMVAGAVPLVSFSFIVGPLLLLAIPSLFVRGRPLAQRV